MSGALPAPRGGRAPAARAPWSDGLALAALGLALRLVVVGWAWGRIPPVADGAYYHVVAQRIAAGQGYTWLWPDGVVTHAAHYPIGYPALLGALYAVFGAAPGVAMVANAVLGAGGVLAAHRIAASVTGRAGSLVSGFAVALHPGLLAYTPALMTEGVVAALLAITGALAVEARGAPGVGAHLLRAALALLLGATTLVRPQSVLIAPFFGLVSARRGAGWRSASWTAALVTVLALVTVAPWSLRNCLRMGNPPGRFTREACVLVSANGGWNLLIGAAPGATGSFTPIEGPRVPPECREVFGEVEKDRCFGRAGARYIREEPFRWLAMVPAKLSFTFDGCGAASYYLRTANAGAFGERAALALDVVETIWQRLVLLAALVGIGRAGASGCDGLRGVGAWLRVAALLVSLAATFGRHGWLGYVGLVASAGLLGRGLPRHPPAALAAAAVGTTALAHAVFFGAGRYSMVTFAILSALAGTALRGPLAAPGAAPARPDRGG